MTGLVAAVVGGRYGPARAAAQGLRALGADVTELTAGSRVDLAAQLRALPSLRLVVWAPSPGAAAVATPLLEQSGADWDANAAQPLREAVACFQAAEDVLEAGAVVAILPTIAMNGSAGFTAWSTASEGLRSLVKVSSREFSKRGITVNAIAMPAALLAGVEQSLNRPGLPAATLPNPGDAGATAGILASLASSAWACVTGATIAVDGGVWVPA